jgi:hypothetical protein
MANESQDYDYEKPLNPKRAPLSYVSEPTVTASQTEEAAGMVVDGSGNPKLTAGEAMELDAAVDAVNQAIAEEVPVAGVDTSAYSRAAQSPTKDSMIDGQLQAARAARSAADAQVFAKKAGEMVGGLAAAGAVASGLGGGAALLASAPLFAPKVFDEALASLKTGDFAALEKGLEEIKSSAKSVLAHMNFLESSPDGTRVTNYAGLKKEPIVADISDAQLMSFASPVTANMPVIDRGVGIV